MKAVELISGLRARAAELLRAKAPNESELESAYSAIWASLTKEQRASAPKRSDDPFEALETLASYAAGQSTTTSATATGIPQSAPKADQAPTRMSAEHGGLGAEIESMKLTADTYEWHLRRAGKSFRRLVATGNEQADLAALALYTDGLRAVYLAVRKEQAASPSQADVASGESAPAKVSAAKADNLAARVQNVGKIKVPKSDSLAGRVIKTAAKPHVREFDAVRLGRFRQAE